MALLEVYIFFMLPVALHKPRLGVQAVVHIIFPLAAFVGLLKSSFALDQEMASQPKAPKSETL